MANEILVKSGSPITVTITLAGLTTSTTNGARQSAKIDFGATRAQTMLLRLQTAFTTAPTAGGAVEIYVAFSSSSTAASDNPVNLTGADAAYAGYGNDVDQAKRQLVFVGVLSVSVTTSTTVPQVSDVGTFTPMDRYGQVIVCPRTSQPLSTNTTIHAVTIYPLVDEVQ
jgi:hypothetical protein